MSYDVQGLFTGLALTAFAVAGAAYFQNPPRMTGTITCGGIGILLLALAIFWPQLKPFMSERLVISTIAIASDARYWLGGLVLILIGFGATSFTLMRERDRARVVLDTDINLLRMAIERYLIPRHLAPDNAVRLKEHLRNFEPSQLTIAYDETDPEATAYAHELALAIKKSRWKVDMAGAASTTTFGLSLHYQMGSATRDRQIASEEIQPNRTLVEALRLADVVVSSNSEGGSSNVTQDQLTLTVGPRPRDGTGDFQSIDLLRRSRAQPR